MYLLLARHRSSPLPHPATQRQYPQGGQVEERAGSAKY